MELSRRKFLEGVKVDNFRQRLGSKN